MFKVRKITNSDYVMVPSLPVLYEEKDWARSIPKIQRYQKHYENAKKRNNENQTYKTYPKCAKCLQSAGRKQVNKATARQHRRPKNAETELTA